MDDDLKMNYNETDEVKSQKELVRKAHKILHGTSDHEKVKKALKEIDDLIRYYENEHKVYVISDQPAKVTVTKKTIDDLEGIKKILEAY